MNENELQTGKYYKGKTGHTFLLCRNYAPNIKCFERQDGQECFGREFIEYKNGERDIDLIEFEYPFEVFHPDSECNSRKFKTWSEAIAAQVKWNRDIKGHIARRRRIS